MEELFSALWARYAEVTPQAPRVRELLGARGEEIVNDHIALRTLDRPGLKLEALAAPFVARGYRASGDYDFPVKRLRARSYSHPDGWPRVFVSELRTDTLGPAARSIVDALCEGADPETGWPPCSHADYLQLLAESEYAAWLGAFGLRVNHFTVSVNALRTFDGLEALNAWLQAEGFELNASGGLIKGGPEVYLAQSSTRAERVPRRFACGTEARVPSCYYEFALRYPEASGALFDGFVTGSADRIFESTDTQSRGR